MPDALMLDVCRRLPMMSVAHAPEKSKADDFNQAMSVAMSVILSIPRYISLGLETVHQAHLHAGSKHSKKV
jgi:hypothetical protein